MRVKDCKVIPGEATGKQHRVLVMRMQLRPQQEQKKVKQGERIRTWKLKGDNTKNFKQKMEKLMQETKDITWENLKTNMLNTARKICGVTRGQKDQSESRGGGRRRCNWQSRTKKKHSRDGKRTG